MCLVGLWLAAPSVWAPEFGKAAADGMSVFPSYFLTFGICPSEREGREPSCVR